MCNCLNCANVDEIQKTVAAEILLAGTRIVNCYISYTFGDILVCVQKTNVFIFKKQDYIQTFVQSNGQIQKEQNV